MILERINSPADVKRLSGEETALLCEELRQFLVEQVSRTGGHLASNLGVVELTVAIHRVFDTARDRLVLDVGHQCYVHKALTGRRELFGTLRQFGGLSGFPKPYESGHDAFMAGHASDSVSVALGMARARTLLAKDYHVVAVIGDGALGGGLSFEGLNDAGGSGEPLVVILNDNGMSIDRNVGGLSKHLSRMRTDPEYYEFKKKYRKTLEKLPAGRTLYEWSHEVKSAVKKTLLPPLSTVFEEMGFSYMGPVDGHDIQRLTAVLREAREAKRPVLVHVHTVKGNGYAYALREPERFHGVPPFDPATGKVRKESGETFSHVFGETLCHLARQDDRVCAITAAMADGTGLTDFAKEFPRRFFDVGIAEGHAVTFSAGLAAAGMVPFCNIYSTFMQRAYDNVIHDVAIQDLPVVMCLDRGGLVGEDGVTHHGVFDMVAFAPVPGLIFGAPMNERELRNMMYTALHNGHPFMIRYPRGTGEGVAWRGEPFETLPVGRGRRLREGSDVALVTIGTVGNDAARAAVRAAERGVSVAHYDLRFVRPLDEELLREVGSRFRRVVTVEDGALRGGVGEAVTAFFNAAGYEVAVRRLGVGDRWVEHGTPAQLHALCGYDEEGILAALLDLAGVK